MIHLKPRPVVAKGEQHSTYVALILKICFRVAANVVRTPATCQHDYISTFECVYEYCME